jgi:hypothetical protein
VPEPVQISPFTATFCTFAVGYFAGLYF